MMPNADAIALGKQIKAVRKAMGMTQDQLALKSHVSVKYIANIENECNPPCPTPFLGFNHQSKSVRIGK